MIELQIHELLQAAYDRGEVSPFDLAAGQWGNGDAVLDFIAGQFYKVGFNHLPFCIFTFFKSIFYRIRGIRC